jgi:uncharacterized membrane protein
MAESTLATATGATSPPGYGRLAFGLSVIALAVVALAWRDFDLGQPVPRAFPDRAALALAVDGFMLAAGVAVLWRRTAVAGGAALAAYYALVVVVLMYGRQALIRPAVYGVYSGAAEQLALALAGLLVFARTANLEAAVAARLVRASAAAFGVCAILFGGAHFVYMNLTAPLVPKWLPPSQTFWGYATGLAQIAAGVALLTGVRARLAAVLLTIMYAAFTPLVHLPMLLADPASRTNWSETMENLALTGAAWVVAESLARRRGAAVRTPSSEADAPGSPGPP